MEQPMNGLHLGREIIITANQFKRVTDRNIERKVGLTAAQASTLHFIMNRSAEGSVYQKDIERCFGLRSPSVTGMVKQLEQKGLIRRETEAGDARLKRIVLTEEARRIEEQIHTCIFEMEDAISDCLTENERLGLQAILKKISAKILREDRDE